MTATAANSQQHELAGYLSRAAEGDERALGSFYDETSSLAYGLALRITGNPETAGEVVVDAYHQIWRNAAQYRPDRGTPTAWLCVIVRSRALDRARPRAMRPCQAEECEAVLGQIREAGPTPEEAVAASQTSTRLRRALAELPQASRRLLELAYFEGLTQPEIAERTGDPLGTVKTRTRRALQQLRQLLANCGGSDGAEVCA